MSDFNETDYRYFKKEFTDLKDHVTKGLGDIQGQLKILAESYVKRDEFEKRYEKLEALGEKEHKDLREMLHLKLDKEDFEPYKNTLNKLNWAVLAAVVGALLALVIKTT